MLPLFQAYPQLAKNIKHIEICTLPTPVQLLEKYGNSVGHPQIYIKREDLSGELFGTNKVRTLEFLLAEAYRDGGNVVGGLPGTSMALASNIYANQLGIPLTTVLFKQNHTKEAQRNLRYFQHVSANLNQVTSFPEMQALQARLNQESQEKFAHDTFSMSPNTPIGMCGYINAIFELKQQIENGDIPEPDFIYLSAGLLGTSAGLTIGLKATGLKTQLIACNVESPFADLDTQRKMLLELASNALAYLQDNADDFPDVSVTEEDINFRTLTNEESQKLIPQYMLLIEQMQNLENITLDLTWTARAILALEKDIKSGKLAGKTVLYWHTHNSRPYPNQLHTVDYKELPEDFWHYFETDEFALVNFPDFSG